MSKQEAFKFLERMEKDHGFREQIKNAKDANAKKAVLQAAKLNFTKQEVEEALKEKYKQPLSPDQLKNIAAAGGQGIRSIEDYKKWILTSASQ